MKFLIDPGLMNKGGGNCKQKGPNCNPHFMPMYGIPTAE